MTLILLCLSLLSLPLTAAATNDTAACAHPRGGSEVYVSPSGSDDQGDGRQTSPFATLGGACQAAIAAGTSSIYAVFGHGTYQHSPENLQGCEGITELYLFAEDPKKRPVLQGASTCKMTLSHSTTLSFCGFSFACEDSAPWTIETLPWQNISYTLMMTNVDVDSLSIGRVHSDDIDENECASTFNGIFENVTANQLTVLQCKGTFTLADSVINDSFEWNAWGGHSSPNMTEVKPGFFRRVLVSDTHLPGYAIFEGASAPESDNYNLGDRVFPPSEITLTNSTFGTLASDNTGLKIEEGFWIIVENCVFQHHVQIESKYSVSIEDSLFEGGSTEVLTIIRGRDIAVENVRFEKRDSLHVGVAFESDARGALLESKSHVTFTRCAFARNTGLPRTPYSDEWDYTTYEKAAQNPAIHVAPYSASNFGMHAAIKVTFDSCQFDANDGADLHVSNQPFSNWYYDTPTFVRVYIKYESEEWAWECDSGPKTAEHDKPYSAIWKEGDKCSPCQEDYHFFSYKTKSQDGQCKANWAFWTLIAVVVIIIAIIIAVCEKRRRGKERSRRYMQQTEDLQLSTSVYDSDTDGL